MSFNSCSISLRVESCTRSYRNKIKPIGWHHTFDVGLLKGVAVNGSCVVFLFCSGGLNLLADSYYIKFILTIRFL